MTVLTDKEKPFAYRHDEPKKLEFILRYVTPTTGTRPQILRGSALNHAYQGTSLFKFHKLIFRQRSQKTMKSLQPNQSSEDVLKK